MLHYPLQDGEQTFPFLPDRLWLPYGNDRSPSMHWDFLVRHWPRLGVLNEVSDQAVTKQSRRRQVLNSRASLQIPVWGFLKT